MVAFAFGALVDDLVWVRFSWLGRDGRDGRGLGLPLR